MGMYLAFIITSKRNDLTPFTLDQIRHILGEQHLTNDEYLKYQIKVMGLIEGKTFALTYLDCLEFVFFENCLWHKNFFLLVSLGKSILMK
jgi:hypothetical protein